MSKEKTQGSLVDGFLFQEEELAEKARHELEGIRYVKGKTNMDKPKLVLQVYDKIIEQELFSTPVGVGYLRDLQEYLYTIPSIPKEDIRPIPVEKIIRQEFVPAGQQEQKTSSGKLWISLAGNIILALVVVAMFLIAFSSNHPTILNYEEKLLDKYAPWEQELKERERMVQQKEQELGIRQEAETIQEPKAGS